jgi:hypothetical protein
LKNRKHILCLLNLVLFLFSFTLLSLNSFAASNGTVTSHIYKQFHAKPEGVADNSSQQLSEKSETESEDGCELQALTLPFFFSCLQSQTKLLACRSAMAPARQLLTPIYLSAHNFRI